MSLVDDMYFRGQETQRGLSSLLRIGEVTAVHFIRRPTSAGTFERGYKADVKIQSSRYNAEYALEGLDTSIALKVGDRVFVEFPNGESTRRGIITGLAEPAPINTVRINHENIPNSELSGNGSIGVNNHIILSVNQDTDWKPYYWDSMWLFESLANVPFRVRTYSNFDTAFAGAYLNVSNQSSVLISVDVLMPRRVGVTLPAVKEEWSLSHYVDGLDDDFYYLDGGIIFTGYVTGDFVASSFSLGGSYEINISPVSLRLILPTWYTPDLVPVILISMLLDEQHKRGIEVESDTVIVTEGDETMTADTVTIHDFVGTDEWRIVWHDAYKLTEIGRR